MRRVVGLVTIGQSPREDVVPDVATVLGPAVDIVEAGALDGLPRPEIERLAPRDDDEVLVTRLADGTPVFVGKERIVGRVEAAIATVERAGATVTILLCTGAFPRLAARCPLVQPQPVLLGALRGLVWPGRLGIVAPSARHVPQTEARWRADGFDPVVVALSPYAAQEADALPRLAAGLRDAACGLVVMDCMGFRRKTRDELQAAMRVPVLLAPALVARVAAELCGA